MSRLKQDFDRRLADAELRFMQKKAHSNPHECHPPHQAYCGHNAHAHVTATACWEDPCCPKPGNPTTNDVTWQLNELQVNLKDQVSFLLPLRGAHAHDLPRGPSIVLQGVEFLAPSGCIVFVPCMHVMSSAAAIAS